jgi:type VI secretion system protein ImpI
MPLTLQLVNETTLPDGGPVSIQLSGKRGIDIGRAAHLDWTLPDPTRYISSKHCEIRYNNGGYWLHDVSTNGTFLNGADHRMHAPHRLRNGDRFSIGQYIVAVTLEGAEEAVDENPAEATPLLAQALSDQDPWGHEGDIAPAIDPKELRPARQNAVINPDFLDWSADVPDPFQQPVTDRPAPPPTSPTPLPAASDVDWAGAPLTPQTPAPAAVAAPAPRRQGLGASEGGPWQEQTPAVPTSPAPGMADSIGASGSAIAVPTDASQAFTAFLRDLSRSTGLSEDLLQRASGADLAQQIGTALRLLAENLMQLLTARQQAKRFARNTSHTVVQATDNNPLKFSPSASDALAIMFGPKTASYLDAQKAIGQAFEDLKKHEIKTYAAMQQALATMLADLDPNTIEREAERGGGAGMAGLLASRKAKLWDTYKARWDSSVRRRGDNAMEAFMQYFAEYYDRQGG